MTTQHFARGDWKFPYATNLSFPAIDDPMWKHHVGGSMDPLDLIAFADELGMAGVEDNRLSMRTPETQIRMGEDLARRGMRFGCFGLNKDSIFNPTLESLEPDVRAQLDAHVTEAGEIARRLGGRCVVTNSKRRRDIPHEVQLANAVENLKRMGEIAERQGIVLCIEASVSLDMIFNHYASAYQVVKAVDSPAVRLVFDTFHIQAADGNILTGLDLYWPMIETIQLSDCPFRQPPGFGEINFVNILRRLREKGYQGLVGIECRSSGDDAAHETRAIELLRTIDSAA